MSLLPAIRKDGRYTKSEIDKIAAYSLMVHAEIEYYLEIRVIDLIDLSLKRWITKRVVTTCSGSILAHYNFNEQELKKSDLNEKLRKSLSRAKNVIGNNNGIKENNVLALYALVGIHDLSRFQTLLSTLNSLGARRGDFAHKSIAKLTSTIDARSEKAEVDQIIIELRSFDDFIGDLTKSI